MRSLHIAAVSVAACACGWNPLLPDTRTPADRARDISPKCAGPAPGDDALGPALIESVEPSYTRVQSGNDRLTHLRGAELHLRPPSNLSPEGFERRARCHEALVTTGRVEPFPNDPYFLAGTWLDIRTRSDGDSLIVAVQADDIDAARAVLDRARHFASPPTPPTPPTPPAAQTPPPDPAGPPP